MIQEQISEKMLKLMKDTAFVLANSADDFAKKLLAMLGEHILKEQNKKMLEGDGEIAVAKMMEAVRNGENVKTIVIPDEEIESLKSYLKECKALFAITDLKQDDAKMLMFLERDTKKVKDALTLLKSERGLITEIHPDLFLKHNEKKAVSNAKLNNVEIELFRHHAKSTKLPFAIADSNGSRTVLYNTENQKLVNDILAKVAWDLTGERGPQVRQQIEYRLEGKKEVNIAIEDAQREYYIVNSISPKNYIKITPQDFTYYKNNKEITSMKRTDPDFKEAVYTKLEGLVEPVVLKREEFNTIPSKLRDNIEKKTNIYPVGYTAVEEIERKFKETRAQEIAEMKKSLDNGYQLENASDYDNPSVSFSEFLENEIVNDGHDREHAEAAKQYMDGIECYDLNNKVNSKQLDKKIKKASDIREQQQNAKEQEEQSRDDYSK